eukprot:gene8465-4909_t
MAGTPALDKQALVDWAGQWPGAGHPDLASWTSLNDPCTSNLDVLTSLEIIQSDVVGGLSDLSRLSALIQLNLQGNSFAQLPPIGFSALTSLHHLQLNKCSLRGLIPAAYSNLAALTFIDMSYNSLNGSLPKERSSLSNLEELHLKINAIMGTLPATYSALAALTFLDMRQNSLNGILPGDWACLSNLEELHLANNKFTGTLPLAWFDQSAHSSLACSMEALKHLNLNSNNLGGRIPENRLTQLETLHLSRNSLSGPFPDMSGYSDLKSLYLSNSSFSDTLMASWIVDMFQLTELHLNGSSIMGSLPAEWSEWTTMEVLYLNDNLITGSIPWNEQGASLSLRTFQLGNNSLTGTIPGIFAESSGQLTCIGLYQNAGLCGRMPYSMACFKGTGTSIGNDCIFPGKSMDTPCDIVSVPDDCDTTNIGSDLSQVLGSSLDYSGLWELKTNIAAQTNMADPGVATIFDTWVSNSDPCGFRMSTMVNLQELDLSGQPVTGGAIQTSLSQLTSLTLMLLGAEDLGMLVNGVLPPQWSTLINLRELFLKGFPSISGTLPPQWSTMGALENFGLLEIPGISGCIPEASAGISLDLREVFIENTGLGVERDDYLQLMFNASLVPTGDQFIIKSNNVYNPICRIGEDAPPLYEYEPPTHENESPPYQNSPSPYENIPPPYENNPPSHENGPPSKTGPLPYDNEPPSGGGKDFDLDLDFDFEFEVDFGDYDYAYDNANDNAVGDYNFGDDNDVYNSDYEPGYDYNDGNSFDLPSNPRIEFRLIFPGLSTSAYPGGRTKFLRDQQSMLASAAQVPSIYVILTFIPSIGRRLSQTSAGAEVSAVVWFDPNYEDVPSEISGMNAFELFELRLRKTPSAIFGTSTSSKFDATTIKELAYIMKATQLLPILNCFKSVSKVDVSRPAVASEVFVILYAGKNSQGTTAAPALRVVAISCRCPEPERWCPALDPAGCSYFGRCILLGDGSISDGYSKGVRPTDIVIGSTLPRITLLGAGRSALTSTGQTVMIDEIPFDSNWEDPGATAIGYSYGEPVDITVSVTSYGAGAVNTFLATPPSKTHSFVITYTALDEVGNEAAPAMRLLKPNVTLEGPLVMTIRQATVYSRCPKGAPVGSLCDAGATAEDLYDGPLTQNIKVCGYPFFKNARTTSPLVPILLACNITTRYPGIFTIKFSVTNSAGFTSRVERTLVVESVCLPGSRLCNNLVDCSVGDTCKSDLATTDLGGSVKVLGPTISLVTYPFLGESIEVKRGTPYAFCNGTIPSRGQLCEPGALAFEFSLAGVNATLEDANNDLGAMSLVNRGLGGCAIDTLAPIGSIFRIAFWVWDYGVPAMSAVVVRKVVISKPCLDPAEPNFCRDGSRFFCSPSDCWTSLAYLADPTEVPVVQLLPFGTETVFIEIGNVPPFSLAPCPSIIQNSSCGAVANTKYTGSPVIVQDLTDKIKVTSTTNCKDNPSNCRGCTLAQMTLEGGLCLPGTYKLRYSIKFQKTGVTRHVERTVIIYNTSYSDFPVTRVYDSLTNYSLAADVVDAINSGNMSRSEFMQAQNRVATAVLPQLSLRDANATGFADVCFVSLHIFVPPDSENRNRRLMVEDHEWEKQVQAIQTKYGRRRASMLARIVEVHGWMALADTDWLMQQAQNLDTNNGPIPRDMYLFEEASTAMPLSSVINTDGTPVDSSELGHQDEGLHLDESHIGDLGVSDFGILQIGSRRMLQQDPYTSAVFSIVALAEGMSEQATDLHDNAVDMASSIAVRLAPIKILEDARAAQIQSNYTALIQDAKAEQQMVMDKSDTIISLVSANIDALNNLVIQASAISTVLRDAIAGTVAASDQNIRETLLVQAFNAHNDPNVPSIDCFHLAQHYTRSFDINTYGQYTDTTSNNSNGGRRRKVLENQEANSKESARSWLGYILGTPSEFSTSDEEEWSKALANRYVGMKNNRIIGGLLLHTTRMVDDADCSTDSLSNRLDVACSINSLRSTLSSNGASDELLDQLFGTDTVRPYGIDPVFLRSSTLYDTSLLDQYDLYYNTSNSSEVGPTGVPLGFRWRNMKGYENGFPVLFENRMRKSDVSVDMKQERAANVMQYLMDGNYLDEQTKGLTAEILSYNRDLHVLGYARGKVKWMLDGSIKVVWEFLGLPALDYLKDSDSTLQADLKVFGKELVALWILIGFFTLYTIWYLVDCIQYYGRAEARDPAGAEWSLQRGLIALPTDSRLIYDILLVGCMIAGGILWSLYMGKYAMEFEARYTYNVYDSVTGRANLLLPKRKDAVAIQEGATIESLQTGSFSDTTAGIDNSLLDSLNISAPWSAGIAGRYLLPGADDSNMDDLSEVMSMAHTLAWYYTTYGIIQAVVIIMLILRLVSSFSFQQRLGLIGDTMVRALPLLFHIFLLILVVLLMFAVAVYIMLGWRRVEVATYKDALQDTALSLVDFSWMQDTANAFLADSHSFKTLVGPAAAADGTPHGLIVLPIEHFVVSIMSIFSFFFVQNVLLIFLLAYLLNVFCRLKNDLSKGLHRDTIGSSGSVLSDLKLTVFPSMWIQLQRLFWKPAVTFTGASRRRVSHHPDADDADAWHGLTTKEDARPKTLEELHKFMSRCTLPGVNQHRGAMQHVKGVRVGAVYIDERMMQAFLIATALGMKQNKDGFMKKESLVDSLDEQAICPLCPPIIAAVLSAA